VRYRLSVLARRLHEQAIGRAQALLHRSIGRRTQRVDDSTERLRTAMRKHFALRERTRRGLEERLRYFDLRPRLRRDRERLNDLSARTAAAIRLGLTGRRQRFETLTAKLGQLDPRLVLARGYAIVLNERDGIVRESADAPVGENLKILLAKDALKATVIE
jgi:exonuclease VII large subunit